jgi:hypothetical protein
MRFATKVLTHLPCLLLFAVCESFDASVAAPESDSDLNAVIELAAKKVGGKPIVVDAAGDINAALDEFRALIGGVLNTTPDRFETGRREVNWNGVPAELTNLDNFPGNFFGSFNPDDPDGRKRGLFTSTDGTGQRISNNDFSDIDPSYDAEFNAFSPPRTFAPVGSTLIETRFNVPGTGIPAVVSAFGVVFSDVDKRNRARVEFYDSRGKLLTKVFAPPRVDDFGQSFVGVVFESAVVALVRIFSGDAPLGPGVLDRSAGGKHDLIIMDDFLYSEPQSDPLAPR